MIYIELVHLFSINVRRYHLTSTFEPIHTLSMFYLPNSASVMVILLIVWLPPSKMNGTKHNIDSIDSKE